MKIYHRHQRLRMRSSAVPAQTDYRLVITIISAYCASAWEYYFDHLTRRSRSTTDDQWLIYYHWQPCWWQCRCMHRRRRGEYGRRCVYRSWRVQCEWLDVLAASSAVESSQSLHITIVINTPLPAAAAAAAMCRIKGCYGLLDRVFEARTLREIEQETHREMRYPNMT